MSDWRPPRALGDALTYLVTLDGLPVPDGVFGRWIDELCKQRFDASQIAAITSLIEKRDPWLQEAGVQLAAAALRTIDAPFELAIARTLDAHGVDPWVLEAICDLLVKHPRPALYPTLVRLHGTSDSRIMRNRYIQPWSRVDQLLEAPSGPRKG